MPPRSEAGIDSEQYVIRLKIRGRATQTQVYPIPARLRESYRKIERENSMSERQDDSERVKPKKFPESKRPRMP